MFHRKALIPLLLLLPLLLVGCLEQLSTTRTPGGATRNFFYFLTLNQPIEAAAYWAPDFIPADAEQQVNDAIARLAPYEFRMGRSSFEGDEAGATAVLSGTVRLRGSNTEWSAEQPLIRSDVLVRGPGYRLTDFEILCCADPAAPATPTATPR